jgi:hypothetical protein
MTNKTVFEIQQTATTSLSVYEVIGCVTALKYSCYPQVQFLVNYVHCCFAEKRVPDLYTLRAKVLALFEIDNPRFWKLATDDRIIESSWSDPKSFFADDLTTAEEYARIILGWEKDTATP